MVNSFMSFMISYDLYVVFKYLYFEFFCMFLKNGLL